MTFKNKPWECQRGEDEKHFELFKKYRDFGFRRTYKNLAHMTGYSVRTIAEIARQNDWVFRARLFDNFTHADVSNLRVSLHEANVKELIEEKNKVSINLMCLYREIYGNYIENGYKLHDDPRANSMLAYYTKIVKLVGLLNKTVNFVLDDTQAEADFNFKSINYNYEFPTEDEIVEECNFNNPATTKFIKQLDRENRKQEKSGFLEPVFAAHEEKQRIYEEKLKQKKALANHKNSEEKTQNSFPSSRLGTKEFERGIEDVPKLEPGNKKENKPENEEPEIEEPEIESLPQKDAKDAITQNSLIDNNFNDIPGNSIASFSEKNKKDAISGKKKYEIDKGSEQYIMTDEQLEKIWYIDRYEETDYEEVGEHLDSFSSSSLGTRKTK